MHKELKNFFYSCLNHPLWLLHFVIKYTIIILRGILSNKLKNNDYINDAEINSLIKTKINSISSHSPTLISLPGNIKNATLCKGSLKLTLANGDELLYDINFNWNLDFNDPEMLYSLHRWGWLWTPVYTSCEFFEEKLVQAVIEDWLDSMWDTKLNDIWEPYSCAERISNYLMYFLFAGHSTISEKIKQGLKTNAVHLLTHLEYKNGRPLSNHLLNNARGLYLYGRLLGDKDIELIGKRIILDYFDKIFYEDGFSREGSSHYQFIFTRWFLELYYVAKISNDVALGEFLQPRISKMLGRCWFFVQYNSDTDNLNTPLIGDTSPDFAPNLLFPFILSEFAFEVAKGDFCTTNKKSFTPNYFFEVNQNLQKSIIARNRENGVEKYRDWLKVSIGNKTLYFHNIKTGYNNFPTHEHIDSGSFVYYVNGIEVICDPGRLNYYDSRGKEGFLGSNHNQILVNDFEPFAFYSKNKLPSQYKRAKSLIEHEVLDDDSISVTINHDGFSRLFGDKIFISRIFLLSEEGLKIIDEINGKGQHTVSTNFNVGFYFQLTQNSNNNFILSCNGKFNMSFINTGEPLENFTKEPIQNCFQYGNTKSSSKITLLQHKSLPINNTFKLV